MPMTPDEFYAHARQHTDSDGRLPLSRMSGWDVFPFEPETLTVVSLKAPELPEPARHGAGGDNCHACRIDPPAIWTDEHWRLSAYGDAAGAPLLLLLHPHEHVDFPDLPDDLAAELGRLVVHVARAIESLPHIARAHVARWGDGGEHMHVFFIARPSGFSQLRGTCLALWDDLLPPVPDEVRDADAAAVAVELATSYGGAAVSP